MNVEEDLNVCGKHQLPMMYRGRQCPWCEFIENVKVELKETYQRGYNDGRKAARAEYEIQEEARRRSADQRRQKAQAEAADHVVAKDERPVRDKPAPGAVPREGGRRDEELRSTGDHTHE